jgi:hypothetical protein
LILFLLLHEFFPFKFSLFWFFFLPSLQKCLVFVILRILLSDNRFVKLVVLFFWRLYCLFSFGWIVFFFVFEFIFMLHWLCNSTKIENRLVEIIIWIFVCFFVIILLLIIHQNFCFVSN